MADLELAMPPPYADLGQQNPKRSRRTCKLWIGLALVVVVVTSVCIVLGVHHSGSVRKTPAPTPTPTPAPTPAPSPASTPECDGGPWHTSLEYSKSDIGVSVSGFGAKASVQQTMHFPRTRNLLDSETYKAMRKEYSIGNGVTGLWKWVTTAANASTYKEKLHAVFAEVLKRREEEAIVKFDLSVTTHSNVELDASAVVYYLQLKDRCGKTYTMMSAGDPSQDIGVPTGLTAEDNHSSIAFEN